MSGNRGSATVYFLLLTLVIFGFLVMATDVGRLYSIQGELQTAADAAALASATRLVGTANASLHAMDQVTATFDSTTGNDNRFNLRLNAIGGGGSGLEAITTVDFFPTLVDALANANGAQGSGIDWNSGAYPKYVRVQITAQAPAMFAPLLNRDVGSTTTIAVSAVAGVSAPVCSACGIDGLAVVDLSGGSDPVNYGLVPGGFYTLYLTPSQQTPNAPPATPPLLADTVAAVQYAILDHIPNGPQDLDLDGSLFEVGAGGISSSPGLTPTGSITAETVETGYPDLQGNTTPGTTVGRDILCGVNVRFGVDPSQNICGTLNSGEFLDLAPLFGADSDLGGDTYAAGVGLQDYATEYDGNLRRVLTMAVVDAGDTLNVLNFRQFLVEMSPAVAQGVNPLLVTGAFRVQYIGTLAPLRCGGVGGLCNVSQGVGRVVLH